MALVYRHIRNDNHSVFYIGIGKTKYRANSNADRNRYWRNIVSKYGREVEIIANNLSWDDACELEQLLISEYGRKDLNNGNLVNMTNGGGGTIGMAHSKETINKIRLGNLGRIVSDETKRKISIANKGRIRTKEHRLKISKSLKNRKVSELVKRKISLSHSGKIHTKEHIGRIAIAKWKAVYQYSLAMEYINYFKSITEAHLQTKVELCNIGRVANNKRKTAGGFIWKYKKL